MEPQISKPVPPSTFPPFQWDDATFEDWRYIQDEEADQVADILIKSPHHHQVYQALSYIQKNEDLVHIKIFEEIHQHGETDEEHERLVTLLNRYFNDTRLMEPLLQQKEVREKSSDFFFDNGVEATMVLAVRSLLKQYAAFKSTNVLIFTRMLAKYPHRRILETMQFVIDVMDPKGYGPDGFAIRSIQKLRLVHAMIRARINQGMHDVEQHGLWKQEWGLPINQQDMIFAIHTFSVEVIDGLRASGEKLSQEEIEDYYLAWHYIGKALGVKDEINPMTYAEGKALQARIYQQQFQKENPNGILLAEPLLDFLQKTIPSHPRPEHIYAIIALYNDKDEHNQFIFEDILKVPISKAHKHYLRFLKEVDTLWHIVAFIRYLFMPKEKKEVFHDALAMKNFNMLSAVISLEKTWTGRHFRISDGFGDLAARKDEEMEKQNPSLLMRIADKFVDGLDKTHPFPLVQIFHKLFFEKNHNKAA